MAGAIAGTAILHTLQKPQLQTITLTVNNTCNLACGHCYLQEGGDGRYVANETIERVIDARARHVAIVGKEPTVNVRKTSRLIERLVAAGKTVSMITNGLRLHHIDKAALEKLAYVDISLDGGPHTYIRGTYERLLPNLFMHPQTNVLHTLYDRNLQHIDDMLRVPHQVMLFSPYLSTQHLGKNTVAGVKLENVLAAMSASRLRDDKHAFLLVDTYHLEQNKMTGEEAKALIAQYGLVKNTLLFEHDPLEHGIVRVTYDGLLLTPGASLHPARYMQEGRPVGRIDEQYALLLREKAEQMNHYSG